MAELLKFTLYASRKVGDGNWERKLIRDLTRKQADEKTRELVNEGYGLIVSLPAAGLSRWLTRWHDAPKPLQEREGVMVSVSGC